jgi:NAD-dependent dihydropyrimidine dehydrogenase PreA subunit
MSCKQLLFFFLITLFAGTSLIAQPTIEWQRTLGGSDEDLAYDVEQTADGGFIIAGQSRSTDGDINSYFGWYDYWLVKLTADGSIEWENTYGGTHHDIARDVMPTDDGGYIVTGHSSSEDGQITEHRGLDDYWITKLTPDGTLEWQRSLGGSDNDFAYAIGQTDDGGYIVAGSSRSTNGDVTGNHGDYDYWVVKLAADGMIEWEQSLGGSESDFAYGMDITDDGGCVVVGKSHSNDGDVTGNQDVGNFTNDYWVVKLSSQGVLEWQKSLGGSDVETPYSVQQTNDGSYIVAGIARHVNGDVTNNKGGWDYWIVKLTSSGELDWQKSLGGYQDDLGHAIHLTNDGGYIAAGASGSNALDVSGNNGSKDFWAVKLTDNGEIEWQKSMGGTSVDWAFSVQQTTDDGFVLAGRTTSNNGDVSGYQGENDYWIVKLNCGVNTELEVQGQTIQSLETTQSSAFQWVNCNGDPISGANDASFSPATSGDYAVIVTNGNCIDTSDCVSICLLENGIMVNGSTLQVVEDASDASFQWIDCSSGAILEGETAPSFQPTMNGEYAVFITDGICTVTSECNTICPVDINTEVIASTDMIQALADTSNTSFQWINCGTGTMLAGQTDPFFSPTLSGEYAVVIAQGSCVDTSECITFCQVDTAVMVIDNSIQALEDAPNTSFQWIDCNAGTPIAGQTEPLFSPTISGEYAVVVNQGNCVDTSECVTISIVGSVDRLRPRLEVFPNPVQDNLIVKTDPTMVGAVFSIYDSEGRKVSSGRLQARYTAVSLNDLPSGMYTLQVEWQKEVITIRLVKSD